MGDADQPRGDAQPPEQPPQATTMRLSAVGDVTAVEPGRPGEAEGGAPVDLQTLASLRPGTALLRVDHGPNAGSRFLLDGDVTTVGRHPSSDIFLDDVTVSRKHAEFRRDGEVFSVRDVGSLNGTYVNRERIERRDLATGDEVQIGKFRLVVHVGSAAPGTAG
ncbi:FHA domain-containing protein [Angustibacter aerolatus]|uniref:Phosphopeptide-binding protein n=1 Tax=Angustibacter aerolatus TaxID=1162965 RepID=A0ABQ6JND8_9ACTN|nr:FHA domain-containing protein [Angustibacter aerolatus]GMA89257.1 phosphopeptide-binding protein [Angustibacter aerolatus]